MNVKHTSTIKSIGIYNIIRRNLFKCPDDLRILLCRQMSIDIYDVTQRHCIQATTSIVEDTLPIAARRDKVTFKSSSNSDSFFLDTSTPPELLHIEPFQVCFFHSSVFCIPSQEYIQVQR